MVCQLGKHLRGLARAVACGASFSCCQHHGPATSWRCFPAPGSAKCLGSSLWWWRGWSLRGGMGFRSVHSRGGYGRRHASQLFVPSFWVIWRLLFRGGSVRGKVSKWGRQVVHGLGQLIEQGGCLTQSRFHTRQMHRQINHDTHGQHGKYNGYRHQNDPCHVRRRRRRRRLKRGCEER